MNAAPPRQLPARSAGSFFASAALLLMTGVLAFFAVSDFRDPTAPTYASLEIYAVPIGAYAAAVVLVRDQRRRLALVAGAAGALGGIGFLAFRDALGFLGDLAFVRADALVWGLMFLLLGAVAMAWWESRLPVRQGVGQAVAGGALGGVLAYGAIIALAVIALSRCGT